MFPFSSNIFWGLCPGKDVLGKHKDDLFWLSVFSICYEEATARIDVDGLPDTCNKRVVLESLLTTARIAFDKFMGPVISLPGNPGGAITGYGYPEETYLYSANGSVFHRSINFVPGEEAEMRMLRTAVLGEQTCALVTENRLCIPFILEVIKFTQYLVDTLNMLDIARENSKDLFLILADDACAAGIEKLLEKRRKARTAIQVLSTGNYDATRAQITPTDSTIKHLQPLTALYEWYQSQYRQECGRMGVANPDKGERLNIPETQASLGSGIFNVSRTVAYLNEQMDFYNPLLGTEIRFKEVEDNAFNVPGGTDQVSGPDREDGNGRGQGND